MIIRRRIFIIIGILFILTIFSLLKVQNSAESGIFGEKKAEWINGSSSSYSEKDYLIGVGFGGSRKEAEDSAYAAISRIFRAEIVSHTQELEKLIQSETNDKKEIKRDIDIDQMTKVSTEKVVENVKISDTWNDTKTGQFYALATLNRNQVSSGLREKISFMDLDISGLIKKSEHEENKLEKVRELNKALKTTITREAYNADLRVIDPSGRGIDSDNSAVDISNKMRDFLSANFNISVDMSGDKGEKVRDFILEGLTKKGFSVLKDNNSGDKVDIVVKGLIEIKEADIKEEKFIYQRWNANLKLIDNSNGKIFADISRSGREGHLTHTEVENKVLRSIQKDVGEVIMSRVSGFIYGEE